LAFPSFVIWRCNDSIKLDTHQYTRHFSQILVEVEDCEAESKQQQQQRRPNIHLTFETRKYIHPLRNEHHTTPFKCSVSRPVLENKGVTLPRPIPILQQWRLSTPDHTNIHHDQGELHPPATSTHSTRQLPSLPSTSTISVSHLHLHPTPFSRSRSQFSKYSSSSFRFFSSLVVTSR